MDVKSKTTVPLEKARKKVLDTPPEGKNDVNQKDQNGPIVQRDAKGRWLPGTPSPSPWQQIHLDTATIDIRRAKNGTPGIHGLQGDELRLISQTTWETLTPRNLEH